MLTEAAESADAVRTQLAANEALLARLAGEIRAARPGAVVTCARGSSDHVATYARYLLETRCGVLTSSAAPSVSSVYAARPDLARTLCLVISQSGRSPDLIATAEAARAAGATVVALVNDVGSPLARRARHVIPVHAGRETSVAATKSFIASLAAVLHLAAEWSGDRVLREALHDLPQDLEAAWQLDWQPASRPLADARSLYVLGRGIGLAAAQEAALKLKETCALHAEAMSSAEVRHGPMALVGRGFPVLLFGQDDATRAGSEAVGAELLRQGAELIVAGASVEGALALPVVAADPAVQPLLIVQSFYRLAESLARLRGHDPDRPRNLAKVTETV